MTRRARIARLLYADLDSKIKYLAQRLLGKVPDPEGYIRALVSLDPSGNKGDYLGALIVYKASGGEITSEIQQALAWHFKYKKYLPVELRDANKLDLRSFPSQLNSLRKLHKTPDYQPKGAKVIYTEGPYSVVEVTDQEAACHFFELGGRWCTGNPENSNHYSNYTKSGPLYIVLKNSKPWAQWSPSGELKNSQNQEPRLRDQFSILTLLSKALPGNAQVKESLDSVNQTLASYRDMEKVLSNPELSYLYARDVLEAPFPAGEPTIARNAGYSYFYALDILKSPFPLGEPAIAEKTDYSYLYALYVLKSPFPAGEPLIAQDAELSYRYARYVLQAPFPAGEPLIAQNSEYRYRYALYVLQDPDPHTWGSRYLAQYQGARA